MSFGCPFMVVCHGFSISSGVIVPRSESESEGNRNQALKALFS